MGREGDASELLELVRSAEQGAFVSTTPSGNPVPVADVDEELVDVGDEATDATPSIPVRLPTPLDMKPVSRVGLATVAAPSRTSPAVAILLLFALAIGTLAALAR